MANYNKNNFIVPVGDDSITLKIRDNNGQVRHTVFNNNTTTFFNNKEMVIIRTDGDNSDIVLDFTSTIEAIQALSLLNKEYSKIKKNYEDKKKSDFLEGIGGAISGDVKVYIFSNEPDANEPLIDGQIDFVLPGSPLSISLVAINSIEINDYIFNISTKTVTLNPTLIGYGIESDDEVTIKYF